MIDSSTLHSDIQLYVERYEPHFSESPGAEFVRLANSGADITHECHFPIDKVARNGEMKSKSHSQRKQWQNQIYENSWLARLGVERRAEL